MNKIADSIPIINIALVLRVVNLSKILWSYICARPFLIDMSYKVA